MRIKSRSTLLLSVILAMGLSTVHSIAGAAEPTRKGYLIGIGGGFAPISYQSFQTYSSRLFVWADHYDSLHIYRSEYFVPVSRSNGDGGAAFQLDFGYAWNEQNAIFVRLQQVVYSTDPAMSSGSTALCWSHYLGPTGRTLFYTMGVAISTSFLHNAGSLTTERGNSPGILLGLGYEFSPHFSLEVNYSQTPTYETTQRSQLMVMFTSTAY